MISRVAPLLLASLLLAGCKTTEITSVENGVCKVFDRPEYAVLGKTQYDQNWIDGQVVDGVAACQWQPPAARPPELDRAPAPRVVPPPPPKKKGIFKRLKERVLPARAAKPAAAKKRSWPATAAPAVPASPPIATVPALPPPTAAPAAVPPPPPPPKPRSDVDELLDPSPAPRRVH